MVHNLNKLFKKLVIIIIIILFIVSVPIYTLGPNKKEHEKYFSNMKDNELAPNIYYLGKRFGFFLN